VSLEDLKRRFDELITTGKALDSRKVNWDELYKWELQCLAALQKTFGRSSVYAKSFQKAMVDYEAGDHASVGVPLLEAAKEDLDFEQRSAKLDKIEGEIQEERAEGKRRAAVAETKFWGSVIELITMQREELKRRGEVNQEISNIHKEIEEIIRQQGYRKVTNPMRAPLGELPERERKHLVPFYTIEKTIQGTRYIASKKGEILTEFICPGCSEENKRWFGSWQIYGDKKGKIFLKCTNCGFDYEVESLSRGNKKWAI
jgi:DNA-directed RNA polymerase subunit M/transcription elongation factor TFIIS